MQKNKYLKRKKLIHYNIPGHAHFLTFSCSKKMPLLAKDRSRQWFKDALDAACIKHNFICIAYVIMPNHVHILVEPDKEDYSIAKLVSSIKIPVSKKARSWLEKNNTLWLEKLSFIDKTNKKYFRFWLQGAGFDRNIFREKSIRQVIDYIHFNPVRSGLVENPQDWKWSSFNNYIDE